MRRGVTSCLDLIKPELILPRLEALDREDALRRMARLLVEGGYCKPSFEEAILARELQHPSGLPLAGHKVAIPHTDPIHVNRSAVLFARLAGPVEFLSMGDRSSTLRVSLVSMLALTEDARNGALLGNLLSVYRRNEILEALLRSRDGGEMYGILRDGVERLGPVP